MELAILWRGLDPPGRDACRLSTSDSGHRLAGTAVFAPDGKPCHLRYEVECDAAWRTRAGRVEGWIGDESVEMAVVALPGARWEVNGVECAAVADCTDLDLGFTPATNLIALRRLNLWVGEEAEAPAAWIDFPTLEWKRLAQWYRRLSDEEYAYRSPDAGYAATLLVTPAGFVARYPGLWEREA